MTDCLSHLALWLTAAVDPSAPLSDDPPAPQPADSATPAQAIQLTTLTSPC